MILEFTKMEKNVKTPTRGNPSDAGLDLYANIPEDFAHESKALHRTIVIKPGENKMIPTGLRFGIPHG